MKKSLIFILLFIWLTGCSNSEGPKEDTTGTPPPKQEDADMAINAFHNQFYDPALRLYCTKSDKTGVAAIWTQAIYWDMLMNAYKRTEDAKYLQLMEDFYQGGYAKYDKYNWDNGDVWFIYDDIMWWVVSLARAYEITQDVKYLNLSVSGFDRVWDGSKVLKDRGSYDEARGGMFWEWKLNETGKMACINYPTVVAAMTLYNITKNQVYLDKAKSIYAWARINLFDPATGKVADSNHGSGPNWTTQLYNQGTCIGAAVMLYKETHEQQYLTDAVRTADYTKNTMSDKSGLLPIKNGIEQGVYAAIFAQYIIRLIEDGNQPQYLEWMQYNIEKGWAGRDMRNLTHKDFAKKCPTGVLEVYDASACPALMQVIPSVEK